MAWDKYIGTRFEPQGEPNTDATDSEGDPNLTQTQKQKRPNSTIQDWLVATQKQ
ncbi:hypothetical protein PAXRUDRAFT_19970 [Paxillus rubicundulus Ve08.2h10]|uniref:Uncharacterized protein n=1 Tax=Paxillus rubicundulus Ve08.2h10 TaxID=930991 RepID=A0A0D0DAX3_9AGAM|nr:hypothetical protein PAXRUDRAFT_19970 [Paxillus rubicundulus Ve08.2h10]